VEWFIALSLKVIRVGEQVAANETENTPSEMLWNRFSIGRMHAVACNSLPSLDIRSAST